MAETKHTPGPWKLTRRDGATHGDSDNLGWDWDSDHPLENTPPEPMRGLVSKEADARLIAAAPVMFEALVTADKFFDHLKASFSDGVCAHTQAMIDAVKAALSAATGKV